MKTTNTLLCLAILSFSSIYAQEDNLYENWINELNNSTIQNNIINHYDPAAYVDYDNDIFSGSEEIGNQCIVLKEITGIIESITILGKTQGRSGNLMIIGKVNSHNGKFAILSSFKNTTNGLLKEYEIIRPFESQNTLGDPVLRQRKAWEKHSNDHDPSTLINEVYATPSYYLNRGKLIREKSLIKEEYSYMESDNWSITLTKKHLLIVNDNLIFEIGTYQSGGIGQYLLIWNRTDDGKWEIHLDSNF